MQADKLLVELFSSAFESLLSAKYKFSISIVGGFTNRHSLSASVVCKLAVFDRNPTQLLIPLPRLF